MSYVTLSTLRDHLMKVVPGETILVEYSPSTWPHIAFYFISKIALENGNYIIIDDILDTLYFYKIQLEMGGFNTDFLDDEKVSVIKIGGHRKIGNVVSSIEFASDFYVHREMYRKSFSKVLEGGEFFVDIVLGFERRLLMTKTPYDRFLFLAHRAHYLGNKKRIAVYLVNVELLKECPMALSILEETSTSVVRLEEKNGWETINFIKSPVPQLDGRRFKVDMNNIINYLRGGKS